MIYVVTVIAGRPSKDILEHLKKKGEYNNDLPDFMQDGYRDSRTWGYFLTKKKAFDSLLFNWNDIWEVGSFTYAFGLVEKFSEGVLHLDTTEEGWFFARSIQMNNPEFIEGVHDQAKFARHLYDIEVQQIEKPKWSNGIINWGMS